MNKRKTIKFSAEFMKKILSGEKTQTRRPIKPPPETDDTEKWGSCSYGGPSDILSIYNTDIKLEIVSVSMERLKDIESHDLVREGFGKYPGIDFNSGHGCFWDQKSKFLDIWDSFYPESTDYHSTLDPWVWVITFRVLEKCKGVDGE